MTQSRFVAFERLEYINAGKMLLTLDLCRSITGYSLLLHYIIRRIVDKPLSYNSDDAP